MYRAKNFIERYYGVHSNFPVGVDEAGRGAIAGPVIACACYIPESLRLRGIADSKTLSHEKRERIFKKITKIKEIKYSFGMVYPKTIDRINIRNATFVAMKRALRRLKVPFDFILVDGFEIPGIKVPQRGVIKGDAKINSIALAGILAKVKRDKMMEKYALRYPEYGFEKHKGYPTREHLEKIKIFGISPIHRKSFKPVKEVLCLR